MMAVASVILVSPVALALPIVGASANTIPGGSFMLDVWGTWREYTVEWKEDDNGGSGWVGFLEDHTETSGSFTPRVYYGVTDWLTVRAALPLEDRYSQCCSEENPEAVPRSATGLGDIIVDPKIQLYRGEDGYPRLAALAGVRFPTGETGGDLPLSDGSTDFMVGGVLTHVERGITGHACITYWSNGERENGSDVADQIVGLASIETPLDESWNLLWEFKGVFGRPPSEFYRTYLCPGIMWNGSNMSVGFSAVVSASATGKEGVGTLDYDMAPHLRIYYRFF
jgi:hypothetical protein